jgi:excisionase family DNA binding protein
MQFDDHLRRDLTMNTTSMSYYRSGQAAQLLGVSAHHVRKLCEAKIISAELSSGKQWRIPAAEITRLQDLGVPPVPHISAPAVPAYVVPVDSEGAFSAYEDCDDEATSPEVLQAIDDLHITETRLKKRKLEREFEEVEDFFRDRDRRTEALREATVRKEQELAQAQKVQQWADSWQSYAQQCLPADIAAGDRMELHACVESVLDKTACNSPQQLVRPLVDAAIQRTLQPYERRKRVNALIEEALSILPYTARGLANPTEWENKAEQAALFAVQKLGPSATDWDIRVAARAAVSPICKELEHCASRENILAELKHWMLLDATSNDRHEAIDIATSVIAKLPVGTPSHAMRKAVDTGLTPIREAVVKRKEDFARVQNAEAIANANLAYIDEYVHREYEFDSLSEYSAAIGHLRNNLLPLMTRELVKERMTPNQLREYIERIVDRRFGSGSV